MSNFLMIFMLQKQFFEKIINEGGRELIVLNPVLDFLCNSAFKNIDLTPGIPKTCFQHSQDVVFLFDYWLLRRFLNSQNVTLFILILVKKRNNVLGVFFSNKNLFIIRVIYTYQVDRIRIKIFW